MNPMTGIPLFGLCFVLLSRVSREVGPPVNPDRLAHAPWLVRFLLTDGHRPRGLVNVALSIFGASWLFLADPFLVLDQGRPYILALSSSPEWIHPIIVALKLAFLLVEFVLAGLILAAPVFLVTAIVVSAIVSLSRLIRIWMTAAGLRKRRGGKEGDIRPAPRE